MLIPKNLQSIIDFVSKDSTRFNIVKLTRIDADKVSLTATDGQKLAIVTYKDNQETNSQFPNGKDKPNAPATVKEAFTTCIDGPSLADTFKSIPKNRNYPILETIAVDEQALNGHVTLTTNDLQALRTIEIKNVINDNFPDVEKVLPKDKPTLTIGFSSELLGKALLSISKMQGKSKMLKMEFIDALSPVKITGIGANGEEILVVVMPMRLDGAK